MTKEPTKAELEKEAEKLGVQVEPDAKKAEIKEAIQEAKGEDEPNVFVARFDSANPPEEDPGPVTNEGPDASAGYGTGVGTP